MAQTPQTTPAVAAAKPKPPQPPAELQEREIATMGTAELLRIVQDGSASEFRRAKACVRLGELGAKEAVPAMAALLSDEHLGVYARYGLEPIADASVDDALRGAMGRLKGVRLIGVVNSLGKRRDAKAVPALARMLHGADADITRAAAAALGSIGNETAVKELQGALQKSSGLTRAAVADALLVSAERMLEGGKRAQAMGVYTALSAADVPKPARLAAMGGIIREETAIGRPK